MANLITDAQGRPIPVVALGATLTDTVDGTSDKVDVSTYSIVRVVSDVAINFVFGGSSAEATAADHFLPAGAVEYLSTGGEDYLAYIANSTSGTIWVSEVK